MTDGVDKVAGDLDEASRMGLRSILTSPRPAGGGCVACDRPVDEEAIVASAMSWVDSNSTPLDDAEPIVLEDQRYHDIPHADQRLIAEPVRRAVPGNKTYYYLLCSATPGSTHR